MTTDPLKCSDCGANPGELHDPGCDVERCPNCGGQAISCDCSNEDFSRYPRLPWTGEWPGTLDAEALGFWCYWGPGWRRCSKDHSGARADLNRLCVEADWNPVQRRWVAR